MMFLVKFAGLILCLGILATVGATAQNALDHTNEELFVDLVKIGIVVIIKSAKGIDRLVCGEASAWRRLRLRLRLRTGLGIGFGIGYVIGNGIGVLDRVTSRLSADRLVL